MLEKVWLNVVPVTGAPVMNPESKLRGGGPPTGPGVQMLVSQTPDVTECGPIPGPHCHVTVWPAVIVMIGGTKVVPPPGPT